MNVLFMTIGTFDNIEEGGLYQDLLRYFRDNGHGVYVASANERRNGQPTHIVNSGTAKILKIRTGNITKSGLIEKGIATVMIGSQYTAAINKHFGDVKFDIILYSTPPITLAETVRKIKKKSGAFTYLMLKDIFPQNAVDIGLMKTSGPMGLIYKSFKKQEKNLYKYSDKIGCMSQANVDYILKHNPEIPKEKVEICPNTIDKSNILSVVDKNAVREKYSIPSDSTVLLYGGNFGKPQNVPFVVKAIDSLKSENNIHFVMCGSGTDFHLLEEYKANEDSNKNLTVINGLPVNEYRELASACNIGLLFLDYRFTIPNFPSRLLDYMNQGLPVITATDPNTDVGQTAVDGGFGWITLSNNPEEFASLVKEIQNNIKTQPDYLSVMSENGKKYLEENFTTKVAYSKIISAKEQ